MAGVGADAVAVADVSAADWGASACEQAARAAAVAMRTMLRSMGFSFDAKAALVLADLAPAG
jgi:hypothetical protein